MNNINSKQQVAIIYGNIINSVMKTSKGNYSLKSWFLYNINQLANKRYQSFIETQTYIAEDAEPLYELKP